MVMIRDSKGVAAGERAIRDLETVVLAAGHARRAEIEARELLTVPMLHADVNTDLVVAFAPRADLSP